MEQIEQRWKKEDQRVNEQILALLVGDQEAYLQELAEQEEHGDERVVLRRLVRAAVATPQATTGDGATLEVLQQQIQQLQSQVQRGPQPSLLSSAQAASAAQATEPTPSTSSSGPTGHAQQLAPSTPASLPTDVAQQPPLSASGSLSSDPPLATASSSQMVGPVIENVYSGSSLFRLMGNQQILPGMSQLARHH